MVIPPRDHAQPVNDIRIPWLDLVSAFIENHLVAAGDNRRQRKILVVRHRRRNNAGIIKPFALGLPFAFEFLPRVPAAPVLLRVKQRNQCDETGEAEKEPLEVAPAKKRRMKAQRPTNAVATTTLTRSVKTSAGHQSEKFRGLPGINRVTIRTVKNVAATTISHARSQCRPVHDFFQMLFGFSFIVFVGGASSTSPYFDLKVRGFSEMPPPGFFAVLKFRR